MLYTLFLLSVLVMASCIERYTEGCWPWQKSWMEQQEEAEKRRCDTSEEDERTVEVLRDIYSKSYNINEE